METETESFVQENNPNKTPIRPIKYKRTSTPLITSVLKSLPLVVISPFNRTSSAKSRFLCFSSILFGIWGISFIHSVRTRRRSPKQTQNNDHFHNKYSLIQNIQDLQRLSQDIRESATECKNSNFDPAGRFPCACTDPLIPMSRLSDEGWSSRWKAIFEENKYTLLQQEEKKKNIEVIFYGNSITYGWTRQKNLPVFQSFFTHEGGGTCEALAMGIPGDRVCFFFQSVR